MSNDKGKKPAETKEPRRALGRGLDALLPVTQIAAAAAGRTLVAAVAWASSRAESAATAMAGTAAVRKALPCPRARPCAAWRRPWP